MTLVKQVTNNNGGTALANAWTLTATGPDVISGVTGKNVKEICRLLWQLWCPNYAFDDATYDATAASFDNPKLKTVAMITPNDELGVFTANAGRCPS